jgi:hypothetical protein
MITKHLVLERKIEMDVFFSILVNFMYSKKEEVKGER